MLAALREIADRTDAENPWLGEGRRDRGARAPGRKPSASGDEVARFRASLELAEQDLRMGDEKAAIESLQPRRTSMLPRSRARFDPHEANAGAVFRLGVAYMRFGETQNCVARHTSESCILPIRGGGVTPITEGSRKAMRYFPRCSTAPRELAAASAARWLNIAHMTLGEYPDGVPEP